MLGSKETETRSRSHAVFVENTIQSCDRHEASPKTETMQSMSAFTTNLMRLVKKQAFVDNNLAQAGRTEMKKLGVNSLSTIKAQIIQESHGNTKESPKTQGINTV